MNSSMDHIAEHDDMKLTAVMKQNPALCLIDNVPYTLFTNLNIVCIENIIRYKPVMPIRQNKNSFITPTPISLGALTTLKCVADSFIETLG